MNVEVLIGNVIEVKVVVRYDATAKVVRAGLH